MRLRGLDRFIRDIARHPVLSADADVRSFLESRATDKEWDALKKESLTRAEMPWRERDGIDNWRDQLDAFKVSDEANRIIAKCRTFLYTQMKEMIPHRGEATDAIKRFSEMCHTQTDMVATIVSTQRHASPIAETLPAGATGSCEELKQLSAAYEEAVSCWYMASSHMPGASTLFWLDWLDLEVRGRGTRGEGREGEEERRRTKRSEEKEEK